MTWYYDGQSFPGWGNSAKAHRHRQFLDMQKARRQQARLDEWERKHDYGNVRSRMRLSIHLKVAEGHDDDWVAIYSDLEKWYKDEVNRPSNTGALIFLVQKEENDSYCWPGFTNEDLELIKLKGTAKLYEIALRYNSAMAVINEKAVEQKRRK